MNDLKGIIEDCNKSDLISDKIIKKVIEIIGQEEWQDLHDENNDVCTTMGELIITLKGVAEVEQENKVLAQNLEDTEIVNKALEKENAELKEELKDLRESIKDYGAGCYENGLRNGKRKLEEQLTKAKELLKKWLQTSKASGCDNINIVTDTEQFLEEIKEK